MAFSQWTQSVSVDGGAAPAPGLDNGGNHIEAVKSLFYQTTSGTNPVNPRCVAGWSAGTTGNDIKIQSMFRVVPALDFLPGVWLEMQGSISTTSAAYFWIWTADPFIQIWKATATQLAGGTGTLLASLGSPPSYTPGSIYAMALQCHYDSVSGSMFLEGSLDSTPIASPNTYNFSTCVPVLDYVDNATPLINGVSAGVTLVLRGSGPGSNQILGDFDVTQIYIP